MGELKAVWDVPRRAAEALRSPLYTNAVYLMLSQATMAGLGFVFWVVVARYYSEA
jgi:O-antigen/teichoic acid export membrane protein